MLPIAELIMELPWISCIGICGPNGYGFLAVLAITKASILGIFLIVRVWFLDSCPELDMFFVFFKEAGVHIIIDKTLKKSFT